MLIAASSARAVSGPSEGTALPSSCGTEAGQQAMSLFKKSVVGTSCFHVQNDSVIEPLPAKSQHIDNCRRESEKSWDFHPLNIIIFFNMHFAATEYKCSKFYFQIENPIVISA